MHHTERVKAARPEFCPQMSSSGHGCVNKNQDSRSQPCPDGRGNMELPVDHRSEILVELYHELLAKPLSLPKESISQLAICRMGRAEICATIYNAKFNHSAPVKHLEPTGVRSLPNSRLDLIQTPKGGSLVSRSSEEPRSLQCGRKAGAQHP